MLQNGPAGIGQDIMTKNEVKAIFQRVPTCQRTGGRNWRSLRSELGQNSSPLIIMRHRTNWLLLTKGLPGKPRARAKSKQPSLYSGRHEGRIFEAAIGDLRHIAAFCARSASSAVAESLAARVQEVVARAPGRIDAERARCSAATKCSRIAARQMPLENFLSGNG